MKNQPLLILIALLFFFNAQAQSNSPDTLQGVNWELLELPPGSPTTLAKGADRWFAGTPNGLYYSDDQAGHWHRHPAFGIQNIRYVKASGLTVMVSIEMSQVIDPPLTHDYFQIWRSNDGGHQFQKSKKISNDLFAVGGEISTDVYAKNDSTWCFLKGVWADYPILYDLVYTQNSGTTWDSIPVYGEHISTFEDTVTVFGAAGIRTLFGQNDFSDPRTDTIKPIYIANNQSNVFRRHGRDIKFDFENRRVLTSSDNWLTWAIDTLLLPSAPYFELIVPGPDGEFYLELGHAIHRITLGDTILIEPILTPGKPPFHTSSLDPFMLTDGLWLAAGSFSLLISSDEGAHWQFAGRGLTCGRALPYFTGGRCALNSGVGIYISDSTGNNFVFHDSLSMSVKAPARYEILDSIMVGLKSNLLVRSSDFGFHWDTIVTTVSGSALFKNGNRLIVYNGTGYLGMSDDQGVTWYKRDIPQGSSISTYRIYFSGDTIILFINIANASFKRLLSLDNGLTWQTDAIPYGSQEIFDNGKFFRLSGSLQRSDDLGLTWVNVGSMSQYSNYYYDYSMQTASCVYYHNGLGFIHTNKSLWATADQGAHWSVFPNLPFYNVHGNYGPTKYLVQGAVAYREMGGFLYAYADGQGVWRTPVASFRNQLPVLPPVAVSNPVPEALPDAIVSPNPAGQTIEIQLSHFRNGDLQISMLNPAGIPVLEKHFSTNTTSMLQLDTHSLPNGLYFLVIESETGVRVIKKAVISK